MSAPSCYVLEAAQWDAMVSSVAWAFFFMLGVVWLATWRWYEFEDRVRRFRRRRRIRRIRAARSAVAVPPPPQRGASWLSWLRDSHPHVQLAFFYCLVPSLLGLVVGLVLRAVLRG